MAAGCTTSGQDLTYTNGQEAERPQKRWKVQLSSWNGSERNQSLTLINNNNNNKIQRNTVHLQ